MEIINKPSYPFSVILPTKNEEPAFRTGLVRDFKKVADKVIVVDGNSSDRTREIAEKDGATVFRFNGGKGRDFQSFQNYVRKNPDEFGPYFAMADADRTCRPEDLEKMFKPIIDGEADMVVGSRFYEIKPAQGSTRSLQRIGNIAAATLANVLYHRRDLRDATCPFWAFTKEFLVKEQITSNGFDLEAELLAKANLGGYRLKTVSIKQEKRVGTSKFLGLGYAKVPYFLLKHYALGLLRK